ncbi:vascular cell adhesion protein 1-like [Varroa destructor]|uniref:Ig-like domain-containing protein n=1 Tax=Varroa destructor TaxID=109461 RepID=A0A7M7JVP1_VARDE|nr:vascular cell adhesion protein 1-like [Varroa destructor]
MRLLPFVIFLFLLDGYSASSDSNVTLVRSSERFQVKCPTVPTRKRVRDIVWFKDNHTHPIYRYSADNAVSLYGHPTIHQHQPLEMWKGRVFSFVEDKEQPMLTIGKANPSDSGVYVCQVTLSDRHSLATSTTVLIVGDSNRPELFYTETGQRIKAFVGPMVEGDDLRVTCVIQRGFTLQWFLNERRISEGYLTTKSATRLSAGVRIAGPSANSSVVQSKLWLKALTRDMHGAVLKCAAYNEEHNLTTPVSAAISLWTRPAEMRIQSRTFSAGVPASVECEIVGSRPVPEVTWRISGRPGQLASTFTHVSKDNAITTSVVTFVPTEEDQGRTLICEAQNQALHNFPGSSANQTLVLNVFYKPNVECHTNRLGPLEEGTILVIYCKYRANPETAEIIWYKDGARLERNAPVLVEHSVRGKHSGRYSCEAVNAEGAARCQEIVIAVNSAPQPTVSRSSVSHLILAQMIIVFAVAQTLLHRGC